MPLPFHYPGFLQCLWIVGVYLRVGNRQLFVSFSKKGSRKLPSNYRPVSLTSVCCKVMESIVYDTMISFLHSNNLISKNQYGFLARRSTCAQLNEWTLFTDIRSKIDSVYIDFAKALIQFPIENCCSR